MSYDINRPHPGLPDETQEAIDRMPATILRSLRAYAIDRRPTGAFLQAVLTNDLLGAVSRADPENLLRLKDIVQYVYNCLPSQCNGSSEHYWKWTDFAPEKKPE